MRRNAKKGQVEGVPLAWPWSQYRAEVPASEDLRRALARMPRREQLPLIPPPTNWKAIVGTTLTLGAFVALGAEEWYFRRKSDAGSTTARDSIDVLPIPAAVGAGNSPENGNGSSTGALPSENAPENTIEGVKDAPAAASQGAVNAEHAAPEARPANAAATKTGHTKRQTPRKHAHRSAR